MILLIGATSYVGRAFASALRRRKGAFIPLSRATFDYTEFDLLFDYVRKVRPDLIINAEEVGEELARGTNTQDHESLNAERMEMLQINTLLPQTIARVSSLTHTPCAHVSSGSIFSGAKVIANGRSPAERHPNNGPRRLLHSRPEPLLGYTEQDEPNCTFKSPPFTFYSGTRALAEEALSQYADLYIWRLHLPFSERDEAGNFLSHLQVGPQLSEGLNSISHVGDCISACLQLWERHAPFGTYNVVNPGAVSMNEVLQMIQRIRKPSTRLQLLVHEPPPAGSELAAPPAQCILDSSKLEATGVKLRSAREALEHALAKWQPSAVPNLRTLV